MSSNKDIMIDRFIKHEALKSLSRSRNCTTVTDFHNFSVFSKSIVGNKEKSTIYEKNNQTCRSVKSRSFSKIVNLDKKQYNNQQSPERKKGKKIYRILEPRINNERLINSQTNFELNLDRSLTNSGHLKLFENDVFPKPNNKLIKNQNNPPKKMGALLQQSFGKSVFDKIKLH